MIIKALTISQPFASLIASGEKWVENRVWKTNYRGPLAIHAGKGTQYLHRNELARYPTGAVIAIANLSAVEHILSIRGSGSRALNVPGSNRTWGELANHEHTEGPFCWILEDVIRIEPVPVKGSQGLWDWGVPESIVEHVEQASAI